MEASFNTPLRGQRGSPQQYSPSFSSPTPQQHLGHSARALYGESSPLAASGDRFIAPRASQDSSLSHYLLTSKENMTPISQVANYSNSRESSMMSSYVSSPPHFSDSTSDVRERSTSQGTTSTNISSLFTKLRLENTPGDDASPNYSPAKSPYSPLPSESEPYSSKLAKALFNDAPQSSVLNIQPVNTSFHGGGAANLGRAGGNLQEECRFNSSLGVVYEANRMRNFRSKNFRVIAQTPERILDAADMIDDFYLNLVDWSVTDVLCVALQSAVYLWEASTSTITQLPTTRPSDAASSIVCGVNWAPDGRHLALGMNDGSTEVWDVEAQKVVRTWQEHRGRVGSLNWVSNGDVLSSGGKDTTIRMHDMRQRPAMGVLRAHKQEVCGLRFNPAGNLLASGGNDNQLLIWDRRLLTDYTGSASSSGARPQLYLNEHTAAVKAIAWNPVQSSLLVSGGGTDDKSLRFWNTSTGECIRHLDTQSQVCGVLWSHSGTELVSSHGFSQNQLTVWKYPSLRKVVDLTGHSSRVLHLCLSADGEVVVSAAGDETIRFWRVFPKQTERESSPYMGSVYNYASPDRTADQQQQARASSLASCHYDPAQDEIALR